MTGRYASVAAVGRGVRILEILSRHPEGLSLTELAVALEAPAATVHRLLQSLRRGGYVARAAASGRHRLSLSLIGLAYRYVRALDWKRNYASVLEDVSAATGELTQLAVVSDGLLFFLDKVEGHHALRVASLVGTEAPVHATASGKVWLASLTDHELLRAFSHLDLHAYTDRTIRDVDWLLADIREVRTRGWAHTDEEFLPGTCGLAVPIRPPSVSTVVGALSVAYPKVRHEEALRDYPAVLQAGGARLASFGGQVYEAFFAQ
jgi:IclR family transcriptional regulator, KDG regulon repressor